MQPVSVFLIDANKLFREAMKALFVNGEFHIAKEASHLEEALPQIATGEVPDLIVLDPTSMTEAVKAVESLKAQHPTVRLVLLASQLDANVMANAIQAGADAFLMKDISPDALAQSLRLVMMGEKVLPTHLAALLISGKVGGSVNSNAPTATKGLSHREVQIIERLLSGDSNKMIANSLGITEATVKVHLKSLLRKINVTNRTQAAIWALEHGFAERTGGNMAIA